MTSMTRTKKLSDAAVLSCAFDVIAKEGFHSFTFAQVSKVVGLSSATLIKRFKNKNRLALLARNQKWEENIGQIDPAQIQGLRGLRGIFDFLKVIALSVNSKRLGEHAIWLGTEACSPSSKRKVGEYFAVTRSIFARLLKEAIADGDLQDSLDPKSFASTLEALVQGAIFQFAFLNESNIDLHLREHIRILLRPHGKRMI
jgi:AcrR family transcriptional regulator